MGEGSERAALGGEGMGEPGLVRCALRHLPYECFCDGAKEVEARRTSAGTRPTEVHRLWTLDRA